MRRYSQLTLRHLPTIDLRFTNCTRAAVEKHLGTLGFQLSRSRTFFHPSKISVSLCSLEEMAANSSPPIALYPSLPESVFRIHISKLSSSPPANPQSTNHEHSLTSALSLFTSSLQPAAGIPNIPNKSASVPSNAITLPFTASGPPQQRPSSPPSFYRDTRKKAIRPPPRPHALFDSAEPDSLAVVRPPPPWNVLETHERPLATNTTSYRRQRNLPCFNDPARIDKRNAGAVKDVANMVAGKQLKRKHSPASPVATLGVPTKLRNPFARHATSVFSKSSPRVSKHPDRSPEELCISAVGCAEPERSRSSRRTKPLKPITSLRVPVLPKECLPELEQDCQNTPIPKVALKQTRLSFPPL
ncbi:hypothetical protein PISMIDRAFT_137401 [Pisolithus microcarpus 441]|uniref:Uncharacterized protein n=1 Tax=Pisolithus microcarpus 441 TaxID=765257 RepID=A0A0D0AAB7_9AGAM|nr:hypothetical protein PISMIDRAFT_137401 [Pisolithus microcarpus 441]